MDECRKEKEIDELFGRLNKMDETLTSVHTIVGRLDKVISGNGQPGLSTRFLRLEGGISVFKWIAGGGGLVGLISLVLTLKTLMGG